VPEKQWEEWQKLDAERVDESYEKDLEQALLMSRLEQEQHKEDGAAGAPEGAASSSDKAKKKKKKKKAANAPMTLEQFNQMDDASKPRAAGENEEQGAYVFSFIALNNIP
jgi:hypothetical protein